MSGNVNGIVARHFVAVKAAIDIAQENIRLEIAALLLGSDAPIVVAPKPVAPVVYAPQGGRSPAQVEIQTVRNLQGQTTQDAEAAIEFVRDNPGCKGRDMMDHLGIESSGDRRWINARKLLDKERSFKTSGTMSRMIYFINEDPRPAGGRASTPALKGKKDTSPYATPVPDVPKRNQRIVSYVKSQHSNRDGGVRMTAVRDKLADKEGARVVNGSPDAITSAITRLVTNGSLLRVKHKTLLQYGHPVILLRAK